MTPVVNISTETSHQTDRSVTWALMCSRCQVLCRKIVICEQYCSYSFTWRRLQSNGTWCYLRLIVSMLLIKYNVLRGLKIQKRRLQFAKQRTRETTNVFEDRYLQVLFHKHGTHSLERLAEKINVTSKDIFIRLKAMKNPRDGDIRLTSAHWEIAVNPEDFMQKVA